MGYHPKAPSAQSIKAVDPHISNMSSSTIHPRRRSTRSHVTSSMAPPDLKQCHVQTRAMSLRKGATFHSPSSPSSPIDDPILNVPSLPKRSPTCPKALEDLIATHEKRVAGLIDSCFTTHPAIVATDNSDKEALPVPRFMLDHVKEKLDALGLDNKVATEDQTNHRHTSDSGLGSSVSAASQAHSRRSQRLRIRTTPLDDSTPASSANIPQDTSGLAPPSTSLSNSSVHSSATSTTTAINKSFSSVTPPKGHYLSEYATKQIQKHIVDPILQEESLKEFHPLIKDIPFRISDRNITCLRDLEKTLIFLAPARSRSASSYIKFCEASIQCIHTTVDHLNETDQRRPTDRPYTNNYFLDLVEQVRQYARIMAATREKEAAGKELDESDYSPDEKLTLVGGFTQNGKPAELVREKNGKMLSIDAGEAGLKRTSSNLSIDTDDVTRSMARKRKCDIGKEEIHPCPECGKEFKRPCDLTKHTKTHSRPWKCPDLTCKYHEHGWPTEKERDRHVNDKHSVDPPTFKCHYEGCAYTSKRESNCKQHMEKSHGWEYIRSKSKNKTGTGSTPQSNLMPTPASDVAFPSLASPMTPLAPSPSEFSSANSRDASVGAGPSGTYQQTYNNSNVLFDMDNTYTSPIDLNTLGNGAFDFLNFNQGMNVSGVPYTPALTDGQTIHTPNSALTHASPDSQIAPNSFEDNFAGHDLSFANHSYPPVAEFFPQYNVQQPTPAMSDLENMPQSCMDMDSSIATIADLSPAGDANSIFYNSPVHGQTEQNYSQGSDFTLFGGHNLSGGVNVDLFPDLSTFDTTVNQFDMTAMNFDSVMMDDFDMFPPNSL